MGSTATTDSSSKDRVPSSASTGTFMEIPTLENQYHADSSLSRAMNLFLPHDIVKSTTSDFVRFGDAVISKQVLDWTSDAERNSPYLRGSGRDSFGMRTDELVTSEGWRNLQKMGLREGIVAIGYENEYQEHSRLVQFLKYHLWTGSCAVVTCPSAMQDGAASLLKRHITNGSNITPTTRDVFKHAFTHLTARGEDAWTSGQWMTERIGGSDVSGTETLATEVSSPLGPGFKAAQVDGLPLGPWVLDGFKWFSSATDSQMAIALAQTPKGLSAFYVPMRRTTASGNTELNGISISRMKNKLGTKAVPTAELELKGVRAYLVGEQGNGVREISAVLNITRVHNAVSSMGLWGRGLAIAKSFANVREIPRKGNMILLKHNPLHIRTLANLTVSYRANMLFTYFTIYLLGISEHPLSWPAQRQILSPAFPRLRPLSLQHLHLLLRVLTPALKALTAKTTISGLQECIEALGGVGYLENEESQHINVARLYRDANVLSIWEGTTNVLGTDFIKTLKSQNGAQTLAVLRGWVTHALQSGGACLTPSSTFQGQKTAIESRLGSFASEIEDRRFEELVLDARELMERFATIIMGTLLIVDAERDGDAISRHILLRFAKIYDLGDVEQTSERDIENAKAMDLSIVFRSGCDSAIQSRL
ncbi:hypothetical protein G7Y89_g14254 [Cudoniella acicularis]|uniref:Acyl-CoA dehydrogenase n=1 Tax=Cudoniella acicularis TaxID=354080 RepID=A0A8H4R3U7_9HELO|nr:hypothetical protein G7Y89_g14254 [Cudoniella acicularis]